MKQFDVSPDKTLLTVSMREKTQGSVFVTITATRPRDPAAEKTDQTLPILEPQNVELENGKVQVYAPDAIEVNTDAEKVVAVQPDPAPQAEAVANARLVSSWIYNHRPIEIPVHTVRKPTRLTAIVATKADVKQGQVEVTTEPQLTWSNTPESTPSDFRSSKHWRISCRLPRPQAGPLRQSSRKAGHHPRSTAGWRGQ